MDTEYRVLYISDFDNSVCAEIWHVFGPWMNEIESICVIPDYINRTSAGYAFVNFYNHEAAKDAFSKVPHLFLGSSMSRVFPYNGKDLKKPPPIDPTNGNGVFIKNLDTKVTIAHLYDVFKEFGDIVNCKIATDEFGAPRNFAYVTYSSPDEAAEAIKKMDGRAVGKRKILTYMHLPKSKRGVKLFIKNGLTDGCVSEEDLKNEFSKYSSFEDLVYPIDNLGKSRGFAFVILSDIDDANRAIEEVKEIHGVPVHVSIAIKPNADPHRLEQANLFVRNLGDNVTQQDLIDEFGAFGTIVSTKIMLDDAGKSRHFGFVRFQDPNQARDAQLALDGKKMWGNVLAITPAQKQKARYPYKSGQQYYRHMMPSMHAQDRMYNDRSFYPVDFYYKYSPQVSYTQQMGEMLMPAVLKHSLVNGDVKIANVVTGILLQKDPNQITQWLYDPHALDHVIAKAYMTYQTQIK